MPKTYTITIGLATEQTARIQIEADSPMAAAHLAIANIPAPGPAWTKHPTAPSDPYILMIDDDFDHIPIEYDRTVATMGTPETKEHRIDTARPSSSGELKDARGLEMGTVCPPVAREQHARPL